MIKFHLKKDIEVYKYSDVDYAQYFVDNDGWLGLKVDETTSVFVADEEGRSTAVVVNYFHPHHTIKRILPKIGQITWE